MTRISEVSFVCCMKIKISVIDPFSEMNSALQNITQPLSQSVRTPHFKFIKTANTAVIEGTLGKIRWAKFAAVQLRELISVFQRVKIPSNISRGMRHALNAPFL